MSGNVNGGPCGACKFLRRKCVRGCVFAPYFDAEQGTARFAAVHKVFGASNASKMLTRLPSNKRLDAAVTLSYEALARLRDPVYGPVSHIFSLQHQVVNLQAELAYVQARLSTFQRFPSQQQQQSQSQSQPQSSPRWTSPSDMITQPSDIITQPSLQQVPISHCPNEPSSHLDSWADPIIIGDESDGELQQVAMQFAKNYFPAAKLPAPTSG